MISSLTKTQRNALWQAYGLQIVRECACPDCSEKGIVWGMQLDQQPRLFYVCLAAVEKEDLLSCYVEELAKRSADLVCAE
jgi:hypothetical protein